MERGGVASGKLAVGWKLALLSKWFFTIRHRGAKVLSFKFQVLSLCTAIAQIVHKLRRDPQHPVFRFPHLFFRISDFGFPASPGCVPFAVKFSVPPCLCGCRG